MAKKKKDETITPGEASPEAAAEEKGGAEGAGGAAAEPAAEAAAGPGLEEELNTARAAAEKNWDLYLRAQAELENYRKRVQREKEDLARFANEAILREVLPVVDNLERAVAHAGEQTGQEGLLEGVEMTLGQFQKFLEKFGVRPIKAVGESFSPAVHEAIGQVESGESPPNTVVQEFQKGYLLHDRLLRPTLVMVAKAPSTAD